MFVYYSKFSYCLFVCVLLLDYCIHVLFVTFRVFFIKIILFLFQYVVKKENCRGCLYNVFIKFYYNYVCVSLMKKTKKNFF